MSEHIRPDCECHGKPMRWRTDSRTWRCAVKALEADRRWREEHPEKDRERSRRYAAANPEHIQEYHRTLEHGMTREQRDWLYAEQGGACAGCLTPMPDAELHVDHDHGCCGPTNSRRSVKSCGRCIRGLVCRSCNRRDVLAGRARVECPREAEAV